mgnify:CR=1 FL=1
MSSDWKYITFEDYYTGMVMVVFPSGLIHAQVARSLCGGRDAVKSAGFVSADLTCYGLSESLNIVSNPEVDNKLLAKLTKRD